jgi:predicted PurR-regulated permease PerM
MINHFLLSVGDRIGLLLSDYFNSSEFNRQLKDLGTGILNTALGATQFLIDFLLALVMSIYMLADKENMIRGIKRIVYAVFKKETADKAVFATKKTNEIFKKFFLGKGLASIIVGIVAFIFASLTKLPVPILQAAILGITNMVPTIGPVIGAVPCLLLTLLYSPVQALWLLIFILVVQQIDGMYLSPKILGDSLGLKPLFVIVGVLIGGSIAGILGALLGTPTLAVISYFLNRYTEKRLKEKQLNI